MDRTRPRSTNIRGAGGDVAISFGGASGPWLEQSCGSAGELAAAYRLHHLARFTFWSANRDRPCTGGGADTCSGVSQSAWDYTRIIAQYQG